MEHRQRRPCHAGTLPAGTVAPGSVPAPAARHRNGEQIPTAHDMHRDAPGAADRTASADRRPEQQRTMRRRPGLFLLPRLHPPATCPACRISSPARAGRCAAVATMTTPAHRRRSRSHRPPPAPGRISTASAAPDDHASSRPPPTMTTHQRQRRHLHSAHSLPALPDLPATAPAASAATEEDKPASAAHLPPPASLPPEGSDSPPNGIEL